MTWEAVDAVDDALDATRRFLFPFSVVRWAKLALLVVFMGAGVNTSVSVPPVPTVEADTMTAAELVTFGTELGIAQERLIALGVTVAGLSVLFAIVSVSLRLVFYDALHTTDVRLWQPFKGRLRQATGLFGFSLVVGLALATPFVIAAIASKRGLVDVNALSTLGLGAAITAAAGIIVLGILVLRVTYEFVVPVMVLEDRGVLAGWRRFYPTLRTAWTGFVVYFIIHLFLALAISIAETVMLLFVGGVAVVLAALALLVAAGVLGGLGALTGTTAGIVATVVVVLFAVVAVVIVLLPVRILTRTYLIAYEVSTLGNIEPQLALLGADADADEGHPRTERHDSGRGDADSEDVIAAETTSTAVPADSTESEGIEVPQHDRDSDGGHRDSNDGGHRDSNETTDELAGGSTNDRH